MRVRSLPEVLYNFHWVVPGEVARSSQAYAGFLGSFLKAHGIAGIINLRGSKPGWRWWDYETRVCAVLGVAHRDVRFNSRRLPTRATLLDMVSAFDEVPRPILIKCSGGQDRTSFAAALYLLHTRGWGARREAEAQFATWPYLHFPKTQQRWLRALLPFLEGHGPPANLRVWIGSSYRPEDFQSWLQANGLGDAFSGLYRAPATPDAPLNAP